MFLVCGENLTPKMENYDVKRHIHQTFDPTCQCQSHFLFYSLPQSSPSLPATRAVAMVDTPPPPTSSPPTFSCCWGSAGRDHVAFSLASAGLSPYLPDTGLPPTLTDIELSIYSQVVVVVAATEVSCHSRHFLCTGR